MVTKPTNQDLVKLLGEAIKYGDFTKSPMTRFKIEKAIAFSQDEDTHEELLAIVKEIYADENDLTRRKHSDDLRFRMEEAIAKAEGK